MNQMHSLNEFRAYQCDYGHSWEKYCPSDASELEMDTRCPEGHDAVTCSKAIAIGSLEILLHQAARIPDRFRPDRTFGDDKYCITIVDINTGLRHTSSALSANAILPLITRLIPMIRSCSFDELRKVLVEP